MLRGCGRVDRERELVARYANG
ncbi:MAG: hypothetical protein JWO90_1848, partial [Solirubrobacterales bacterium]|nr:hypothetical protein [Solirubrobacterales bacterium]